MIAEVMRQHSPEKEAEKEQNDRADENRQPEVNQEFHDVSFVLTAAVLWLTFLATRLDAIGRFGGAKGDNQTAFYSHSIVAGGFELIS